MGENLGIRKAVLIAQHNDRFVPAGVNLAVLRIALAAAAWNGDGVLGLAQRGEQVVGRGAAAVFTHVDDETVFAGASGKEFFLKALEALIIHRGDVQIAKRAARSGFDHCRPFSVKVTPVA